MAFVNAANAFNSGGTGAITVSVTYSPVAGNTLVVLVNAQSDTAPVTSGMLTSVTDNAVGGSSTYTPPTGSFSATTWATPHNGGTWMLYCQSVKSGVTTLTATLATGAVAASFISIVVAEYSGLGLFDVAGAMTGVANVGTGANAVSSGSATPSGNGDTIIGLTIDFTGNSTIAAGTTVAFTANYSVAMAYMIESFVQVTAASIAATYTSAASAPPDSFNTGMLAFSPPGASVVPDALDRRIFRLQYPAWR